MRKWSKLAAGILGGLALYGFVEVYCIPPIGSISTDAKAANIPFVGVGSALPQICPPEQGPDVCFNGIVPLLNQNMAQPPWGATRNWIDNGSMAINQRGTTTQTCGTTGGVPASSYSADRWGCVVNVTSGAGRQVYVTTTPPQGFQGYQQLFRTSGALTQPVCSVQEIETARAVQLAGQAVVLSFYAQALSGLSADNGNVINASIITGTGTDQGLGTFTASPAITPAFTNVATLQNPATTINTTWTRYANPAVAIPSNVTEIAVMLCFTPTATGAGATDGFNFVGVQLEQLNNTQQFAFGSQSAANALAVATPFEWRPIGQELAIAQRYAFTLAEPAATGNIMASGQLSTTTTCLFSYNFPVPMRTAPTLSAIGTALSTSTWRTLTVAATSTLASPFLAVQGANSPTVASLVATMTTAGTAGNGCNFESNNGGSILLWSADF